MTDDQTLESMRVMAGARAALGAAGTTFEQAFVSSALCCPSRATLFTGQYPHNHGVLGNRPPEGGYGRLDKSEWLPLWLQRAGYHTLHIGKFLNRYGQDTPPTEVPPGWDEWYASVDPLDLPVLRLPAQRERRGLRLRPLLDRRVHRPRGRRRGPARAVRSAVLPLARLPGAARRRAARPRRPHRARDARARPPRHRDASPSSRCRASPAFNEADVSDKPGFIRRRPRLSAARTAAIEENYRQELESLLAVDEGVVALVDALRVSGELDNTLIVFTSDNGFFHGEHRVPYGKVMVYEPSIRVPLIMRGPGVPAGVRRRQLVSNADLAPTLLEAAGAAPALPQDGRSLFGLLRDRDLRWGRELLIEGPSGFQAVAFSALRNERFLYAEHDSGERELYDLRRDPHQLVSLHLDPLYSDDPGPPGRAAGRASDLLGIELPLAAARAARAERLPGLGPGPRPRPRAHAPPRPAAAGARGDQRRPDRHARPPAARSMSGRAERIRSLISAGASRSLSSRRCTPSRPASASWSGSASPTSRSSPDQPGGSRAAIRARRVAAGASRQTSRWSSAPSAASSCSRWAADSTTSATSSSSRSECDSRQRRRCSVRRARSGQG